jgi:hypothetical protein
MREAKSAVPPAEPDSEAEQAELQARVNLLTACYADLEARHAAALEELHVLQTSRWWRVGAPLRRLRWAVVTRWPGRPAP